MWQCVEIVLGLSNTPNLYALPSGLINFFQESFVSKPFYKVVGVANEQSDG